MFNRRFVVIILLVISATGILGAASTARGSISPELAEKISAVFPPGSTQEQVKALCGEPEFVKQFKNSVVVWRYVSGDSFVLFQFENGILRQTAILGKNPPPQPAETTGAKQSAGSEVAKPTVVAPLTAIPTVEPRRETWRSFFSGPDAVLGVKLGASRSQVFEALEQRGIPVTDLKCENGSKDVTVEFCETDAGSWPWRQVDPAATTENFLDSTLFLSFQDDRFRFCGLLSVFTDESGSLIAYSEARKAVAAAFQKPAKKLGFWRRKGTEVFYQIDKIVEAAEWETASISSGVIRGVKVLPDLHLPVVLVVVGEKEAK